MKIESKGKSTTLLPSRFKITDLPEKIRRHIYEEAESGCWIWTAGTSHGYGEYNWTPPDGRRTPIQTHRLVWILLVGKPTPGLVLDHRVCDRPICCNPAHLIECTLAENCERAEGCRSVINRAKTHCPKGHPYSPENTKVRNGLRYCRICSRLSSRKQSGIVFDTEDRQKNKCERQKEQTHCKRGHELAGYNLLASTDKKGSAHRRCRLCQNAAIKAYLVRKRAKKLADAV